MGFDQLPPLGDAGSARAATGARPGLLEALGIAVYTTDAEGRLTSYNEAAATLWGWRPSLGDARWCGSWRLFGADGTPMAHEACPMAVAITEGRPVRGVHAVAERPDGTRVPFIPYPTPMRDATGTLVGAVNVLVDISDRRAAEAALAGSEAQLRAVFDTTPECIKLVAPDGTLLQMNEAGLRAIEAERPSEAEGGCIFDLIAPEHRAAWRKNHGRVCRGEALRWEFDVVGLRGHSPEHGNPCHAPQARPTAPSRIWRSPATSPRASTPRSAGLLAREVDHRAKNVLAVALSLVRLSPRRGTAARLPRWWKVASPPWRARIPCWPREGWIGADSGDRRAGELAAFLAHGRVALRGPPVRLAPDAVQPSPWCCTSWPPTPPSTARCRCRPGGWIWPGSCWTGRPRDWSCGGPRSAVRHVGAAAPNGIRIKLIAATVRGQLGGVVQQHWEPGGLRWEMTLGAGRLLARGGERMHGPEAAAGDDARTAADLAGRRIVLVG